MVLDSQGPQGLQQFANQPIPGAPTTQTIFVDCAKELVGRVIGKGGETINELQQRSRCVGTHDTLFKPANPSRS
jgi:hypothetical protein